MKIVFMGTPEFALPTLERLIDSAHEVCLVITQPDRPKGRGRQCTPSPVKELALKHGLPILQPGRMRTEGEEVARVIAGTGAQLCVVAAFGQILPTCVLRATPLGCINIHPSLLPLYRGAAPVQRCLLDGNSDTAVSLMMLTEQMDAGPIVAQQQLEILPDDDARSLLNMASVMGAEILVRVLDEAQKTGRIESEPQDDTQATYAPPIKKEEGLIDWTRDTESLMYHLRGMTPWPGAFTFINGERQLTITQAEPLWSNEAAELDQEGAGPKPGLVTSIKKGFGFTVRTGSGHMLVTGVQPEGKKPMEAWAFCNGRGLAPGDMLTDKK